MTCKMFLTDSSALTELDHRYGTGLGARILNEVLRAEIRKAREVGCKASRTVG